MLRRHLTPTQRRQLTEHGWFAVRGGTTKKKYLVGGMNGVFCPGDDLAKTIQLMHDPPNMDWEFLCSADAMLAQLLMIKTNELAIKTFVTCYRPYAARPRL